MKIKKIISLFCIAIFTINLSINNSLLFTDDTYSSEYINEQEAEFAMNDYRGNGIDDFKYEIGNIPILICAPHTVKQVRNGEYKAADVYTGAMIKTLSETTEASIIYKTSTNGDENYTIEDTEYRNKIREIVEENEIRVIFDLHGMRRDRESDLDVGTGDINHINLLNQNYLLPSINNAFTNENYKINYTVNKYFCGGKIYTTSTYASQKLGIPTIQLEINRNFRDADGENFNYMINTLTNMINEVYNESCMVKVENLKVKETSTSTINLTWDKIPGVSNYEVYRSNSLNEAYAKIETVKNTNYTDSKLKSGQTYYYKVKTVQGDFSSVLTASTICDTPRVKLSANESNKIKVNWNKVKGASGYEIFRATSKNGKYTKIKTINNGNTLSFNNTKLQTGKTYYYKVRAYKTLNEKNIYGNYSKIVSATSKLTTPNISLTSGKRKVTIKWKKVNDASGYEIYRATSKNNKYTKVKTITKSSLVYYTNSNLSSKKNYYYKVRAYKTICGKKVYSSYSTIKNIKTK